MMESLTKPKNLVLLLSLHRDDGRRNALRVANVAEAADLDSINWSTLPPTPFANCITQLVRLTYCPTLGEARANNH